jgi:hypothetical protein
LLHGHAALQEIGDGLFEDGIPADQYADESKDVDSPETGNQLRPHQQENDGDERDPRPFEPALIMIVIMMITVFMIVVMLMVFVMVLMVVVVLRVRIVLQTCFRHLSPPSEFTSGKCAKRRSTLEWLWPFRMWGYDRDP